MEKFDIIYYINLEYRTDRKEHILSELSKFKNLNVVRVNAIYNPDFGPLGCSQSHILTLEHFVNTGYETCLILEDDFEFTKEPSYVNDVLGRFFKENIEFDVLMLSSNTISEQSTIYPYLIKVLDAQTASGYAVHKNFAKKLLANFKESSPLLESTYIQHYYALDAFWKKIQPNNRWYCLNPKVGKQMKSYSDNSKCVVDLIV